MRMSFLFVLFFFLLTTNQLTDCENAGFIHSVNLLQNNGFICSFKFCENSISFVRIFIKFCENSISFVRIQYGFDFSHSGTLGACETSQISPGI